MGQKGFSFNASKHLRLFLKIWSVRHLRACLKFHQSAASDKFCAVLRYIFRRIAHIRLQNMSCSEQNLPAFAQSWKFKHALKLLVWDGL